MNQEVIRLVDISRNFQVGTEIVRALQSITLSINKNEFVALMGPSGSGKSTLMHILGALDTPTSGTATIDGADLQRLKESQLVTLRGKKVGFVFQTFNLLPCRGIQF